MDVRIINLKEEPMIARIIILIIFALLRLFYLAVIVDALLSWYPKYDERIYNIRRVLQKFTDPVMEPIRKLIRPLTERIGIDISPIIAIFAVEIVRSIVQSAVNILLI